MGELDLEESKQSLVKPTVVGQHKETLHSESHTYGTSSSQQWSDSHSAGASGSRGKTYPGVALWSEPTSRTVGDGWSEGASSSTGGSEVHSESHSHGTSETYVSDFEDRATQVYSLEEQIYKRAALLRNLDSQRAIVKRPYQNSSPVIRVPDVEESYVNEQRVRRVRESAFTHSDFATRADAIEALLKARVRQLQIEAGLVLDVAGRSREGEVDYVPSGNEVEVASRSDPFAGAFELPEDDDELGAL